nr:MAG TPA: hypothetical protein [Caudoviricetes sp.]
MDKHKFVSCMIQDTKGDYRKMVDFGLSFRRV